jgi:hypothetical protein
MTKNITLAIDEEVLDKVRIVAAQRQTTVNGLVREFLSGIANEDVRRAQARKRLAELATNSQADLGPDYRWNREELYAERVRPRHEHSDLRDRGEEK